MPTGIDKTYEARRCRAQKMRQLGLSQTGTNSPNFKHGKTDTTEHNIWLGMIARCNNPSNDAYKRYGGRGIKVCDEWVGSFLVFFNDMGPKPNGKTLDRIDNDGPYDPNNCRWASRFQQGQNKRNNRWLTHDHKRLTLSEWSRLTGIQHTTLLKRLKLGWSVERTLTTKVNK